MLRQIKNSNIPYTCITKEVWLSLSRTLENEQIGEIITAMYEYVYEGKEPSFNTKVMNGQWDMLIENIERMGKKYFSKVDNAKASAKKRVENKMNSSKQETENKPILTPQNNVDDNFHEPVIEIPSNSLKEAKGEEFEMDLKPATPITEPTMEDTDDKLQELINNNEDFYITYNKAIESLARAKTELNPSISANTKEMAMTKLENLFAHYRLDLRGSLQTINDDVNYKLNRTA